jgi:flagellar basal body-associated protein FliL
MVCLLACHRLMLLVSTLIKELNWTIIIIIIIIIIIAAAAANDMQIFWHFKQNILSFKDIFPAWESV